MQIVSLLTLYSLFISAFAIDQYKPNGPLRCRVATSKDTNPEYLPVFISLQTADNIGGFVRISGNLNAVFHGQSGYIVSGSVYSSK
ncbi:hypothetical protein AYI69_g4707 [Smittium culicis]|uniref:Uncharacterized protein n=1 Tax=Smittium culicis TaxID=133412 RepID=A0A1R1YBE3_9FUNG|nr:hypothetical protein AYI69_g4707 [Smittium culicis]